MNLKYKSILCMICILIIGTIGIYGLNNHNQKQTKDILLSYSEMAKTIDIIDFEPLTEKWYDENIINFMENQSGLNKEVITYLNEQCKEKSLDPFFVFGLMKLESSFDTNLVSYAGARGLGQLMDNTARPWAKNLGLSYSIEKLYEPKFNIQIFTTHLKYLLEVYDNDIHKVLTAYNRGQGGLKKYVASRSNRRTPAESTYSKRVLQLTENYRNSFENS